MNQQKTFELIQKKYQDDGLWGQTDFSIQLPKGLERGQDTHLAFLTLIYTISGGRPPEQLWQAARQTYQTDPQLFEPKFLAYAKPGQIQFRLQSHKLIQKLKIDSTSWQRIGQALVMRANGSVQKLLKAHHHDAVQLLHMLRKNKATFPLLSGTQTAPRWLHGLATAGGQNISGTDRLSLPPSPAGKKVFESLEINQDYIPANVFDPLDALGRKGCAERKRKPLCPVASECPVAEQCQYTES